MKLFEMHVGKWRVLVQTRDVADRAITTPKLADGSVTAEKMEASLYGRLNDHRTTTDKVTDALGRTQTQINQQLTDAINNWIFAGGTPPAAKTLQAATGDEYMVVNTADGLRYLKLSDFIKAISDEFIDALDHLDEQGGENQGSQTRVPVHFFTKLSNGYVMNGKVMFNTNQLESYETEPVAGDFISTQTENAWWLIESVDGNNLTCLVSSGSAYQAAVDAAQ